MTYKDVKSEIFNLGFEKAAKYKDDKQIIPQAISRAIARISNEIKPLLGKYAISQIPLKNLLDNPMQRLYAARYAGEELVYFAQNAKSYYFECDGIGTVLLSDKNGEREIELNASRAYKSYRGFCEGNTKLTFKGDYTYNVKNIALYGELLSAKQEDIPPFAQYIRYNLEELTTDFAHFAAKLHEDDAGARSAINNYEIEGRSTIVLNGFEHAQFVIFYKRNPPIFTHSTPEDASIEIDSDIAYMLPLLAAYYVWLDDEERKATMYLNLYEQDKEAYLQQNALTVANVARGVSL